jgi:hypothetical protein
MLIILSDNKRRQFEEQFIGSSRLVLFESYANGKIQGHTDNYIKVSVEGNAKQINEILPVVLVANNTGHVAGKLQN